MAGGPHSRPLGVDSGPGEGGSEGVRRGPKPYKSIHFYSHPDVHHGSHDPGLGIDLIAAGDVTSMEVPDPKSRKVPSEVL